MIITNQGHYFLKIQQGDTVVAVNPISKDSSKKSTKFGADVSISSLNHEDLNGTSEMVFGEKVPFQITGPGEYEVKDITIKGFGSESNYDGDSLINTIYLLRIEGVNICILGALGNPKLPEEAIESLEEVDILFVPVSKDTLSASEAYKVAVSLEAKLIVPLGEDADLKQFAKEAGSEKIEKMEKLTIKKKDLEGKDGEVFMFS